MKKASIVVPVYNTEPYLERCMRSLFAQTYPNIEILAVNDASTDRSQEKLQSLAHEFHGGGIF